MSQFENVSVVKKANVYFDGKCVSHTVLFPDGTKKTVGVIFPSSLVFNTGLPEIMEINGGVCKVRLKGENEWKTYRPANSSACRATAVSTLKPWKCWITSATSFRNRAAAPDST